MKKLVKTIALLMAMVLCLSVTAFAANEQNDLASITAENGAVVEFVSSNAEESQIQVTYSNAAITEGGYYLVMVLANDGSDNIVPTESNILYMDQVVGGNGTVTFTVYASKEADCVEDSVIMFYGLESAVRLATIKSEAKKGDVDGDGYITASDAAEVLRAVAGLSELESKQQRSGDVDGDGYVTASDAAFILRVVAGLDSLD